MCAWLLKIVCWYVWIEFQPMMQFIFSSSHVQAYVLFHSYFWIVIMFSLSLSLSLSLPHVYMNRLRIAPKRKSILAWNPLGSGSSSFDPVSPLHIRFCDGKAQQDFISETWHSFKVPCCSVGLFLHSFLCGHLNSGLGISLWDTLEVHYRVYIGVLLQYTRYRYLCTSVCHYT